MTCLEFLFGFWTLLLLDEVAAVAEEGGDKDDDPKGDRKTFLELFTMLVSPIMCQSLGCKEYTVSTYQVSESPESNWGPSTVGGDVCVDVSITPEIVGLVRSDKAEVEYTINGDNFGGDRVIVGDTVDSDAGVIVGASYELVIPQRESYARSIVFSSSASQLTLQIPPLVSYSRSPSILQKQSM